MRSCRARYGAERRTEARWCQDAPIDARATLEPQSLEQRMRAARRSGDTLAEKHRRGEEKETREADRGTMVRRHLTTAGEADED
nr:unnamed protein product [Digitaria exilis]